MLYLTRKIGDAVVINDKIEVTVIEVRGHSVKLGFTFPEDATVLRKEIHEKIPCDNVETAQPSEALEGASCDARKLTSGPGEQDS